MPPSPTSVSLAACHLLFVFIEATTERNPRQTRPERVGVNIWGDILQPWEGKSQRRPQTETRDGRAAEGSVLQL